VVYKQITNERTIVMAHIKGRSEPAYTIVCRFGGVTPTAKILKINPSTVSRWLVENGTAGLIPQPYWVKLLNHASDKGIKLNLQDLSGIFFE
jgi:hypothetical protein